MGEARGHGVVPAVVPHHELRADEVDVHHAEVDRAVGRGGDRVHRPQVAVRERVELEGALHVARAGAGQDEGARVLAVQVEGRHLLAAVPLEAAVGHLLALVQRQVEPTLFASFVLFCGDAARAPLLEADLFFNREGDAAPRGGLGGRKSPKAAGLGTSR